MASILNCQIYYATQYRSQLNVCNLPQLLVAFENIKRNIPLVLGAVHDCILQFIPSGTAELNFYTESTEVQT